MLEGPPGTVPLPRGSGQGAAGGAQLHGTAGGTRSAAKKGPCRRFSIAGGKSDGMLTSSRTRRVSWPARAGAIVLCVAAAVLLLQLRSADTGFLAGRYRSGLDGSGAIAGPQGDCRRWLSATRLAGGCSAALAPGTANFTCCSHELGYGQYTCSKCSEELLVNLQCLAPRRMLLRPAPGCGAALAPPLPPPRQEQRRSAGSCRLSTAALLNGAWRLVHPNPARAPPGEPMLAFHSAPSSSDTTPGGGGGGCAQRRPLGAPEVPRCLRAAGFDRVVVSGDSTVRHLYNRLVRWAHGRPGCPLPHNARLLPLPAMHALPIVNAAHAPRLTPPPPSCSLMRQQDITIDGGASLVHAHYSWQVSQEAAADSSSDSGISGSGSRGGASQQVVGDHLWYSPPANHVQGEFNKSLVAGGLRHLLHLSAAAAASSAGGGATATDEGSVGSNSGSGSGSSGPGLIADFVIGSRAVWQQKWVGQYFEGQLGPDSAWRQRTLLLLSICMWEDRDVWPR